MTRGNSATVLAFVFVALAALASPAAAGATADLGGSPVASHDDGGSAEFEVHAVADSEVIQGDTFDAEMEVTNEGDATGTRTLTYEVGSVTREREMTLDPGETETWYITVDSGQLSVGEHRQYFQSPSDEVDLPLRVKGGEPEFIVGNLRVEQDGETVARIEQGESARIRYAVLNDGEGRGEQYANCYLAGENVGSEFVQLEPSEIEDNLACSFEVDDLAPGTYEFGVETDDDSWYEEIRVERPPQPPTIDSVSPAGSVDLNRRADDSVEFGVYATDPDSPDSALSTEWFVDGDRYGTGDEFRVSATDLSPGTHTVRAVVEDNQPETSAATREWTVRVVTPPRIEDRTPPRETVRLAPGDAESFVVAVADGDTPTEALDIRWRIDGDRAGSGSALDVDADALDPGTHTVAVTVSDGTESTADVHAEWRVRVLARPEIEDLSPSGSTVTPGREVSFAVDAFDPNGDGIVDVRWEIAGREASGGHATHVFQSVGTYEATVRITNEAGLTTSETVAITAEPTPPRLRNAGPDRTVVDIGDPVRLTAEATDPAGRDVDFDYRWRVDTEAVSETPTTTMRFDEVGEHDLTLTVTNEYGAETTRTYTVRVRNDRPQVDRRSPSDGSLSVISQEAVGFAARVVNRDASPAVITLRAGSSTVETVRMTGDERLVDLRHAFETPGEKTVALSVRDDHGASNRVTWDVDVESRPPELTAVSPTDGRLSVMSGETRTFRVAAVDPEGQGVSYRWVRDGRTVGTGPSIERTFDETGEYDLAVEVTDPQGKTTTRSWTVDVRRFRNEPTANLHLTNVEVDPEAERVTETFLTASMENPAANDRTVVVEFVIETPDGLSVVRQRGVDAANNAQITGISRVQPGSQRSMRVGLTVIDESLVGEDVPVNVTVRYYPAGQPQDATYLRQSNAEIRLRHPGIVSRVSAWVDDLLDDLL
jgi:hypothetical protein